MTFSPRAEFADCAACPLYCEPKAKLDPFVPGKGPDQADVVIVGMAPGETEVVLGKPFIGPSGKLLNAGLAAAGLKREDVYVTNAVLCASRVNGANVPVPAAALKACQQRLYEEIRQHQPKVVVVMGNEALHALGFAEKISDCRGRERWVTYEELRTALHKGRRKRDLDGLHFSDEWARGGFYLLPTYHPAFVLRSPDRAPDLEKDLQQIPLVLEKAAAEERTFPEVQTVVADSERMVCLYLNEILPRYLTVSCDIESTGLDPITGQILTLAYGWREDDTVRSLVIGFDLLTHPAVLAALARLHAGPTRQVWWNGKFDRKWYKHLLGIPVRLDGDGLLAHYALDARKGVHGLKERASDDLGADDYEHELEPDGKRKKPDWDKIGPLYLAGDPATVERLHHYTALDVGMTLMLVERYEEELRALPDADRVYRTILLPAAAVLSDVELTGAAVDVGALHDLDGEFVGLLDGYRTAMQEAASCDLNVSSQPQVATVLYGHAVRTRFPGIDKLTARAIPEAACFNLPLQLNQKRTPGTGAEHCDKILNVGGLTPQAEAFVRSLRSFRLDAQLHRTYIKKLPEKTHADGRVRANFNLHVTGTGRLSSSDPINLQNIPTRREEGKRIKDAFVAGGGRGAGREGGPTPLRDDARLLVEVDLSQAELRAVAFLSRDPLLTAVYTEGRDFHHEVAVRLLGDEQQAVEMRPYVKTFNFALMYGAKAATLAVQLNDLAIESEQRASREEGHFVSQKRWELDEVQAMYDGFWAEFPVLADWIAGIHHTVLTTHEVTSFFGRTRRWPLITRENYEDVLKEAANHPVQSMAADILTLGMIDVHRWLQETGYGRIVLTVHDSLLIECDAEYAEVVAHEAVRLIEAVPPRYGIDVPFLADAKAGQRWGSLKKLKEEADALAA
jgi:DNA polymerase-1